MKQHHRPAAAAGRVPARRPLRTRLALLLAGATSLGGCYTYVPVASVPAPGASLVVDLNDRGRLALGDSIGPSALTVTGVVQSASDSQYVLRVSSVSYLNGRSNQWSGEPLSLRTDLVGQARQKNYSRSRTWALAIGATAAVLGFVLTQDLLGNSGGPKRIPGSPPPEGH